MSEKIKRINRELKFKGKILDFYQDTIEVDGDHTVVWDFIGHKGAAAVVPEQVSDDDMVLLARDIAKQIEFELEYPGQIKVNVIRESRATDYAK